MQDSQKYKNILAAYTRCIIRHIQNQCTNKLRWFFLTQTLTHFVFTK